MKTSDPTLERRFIKPWRKFKPYLRMWVQRLHLWTTLIVGVLVLVISLSGTVALFRAPMQQVTHPHLYHVTPGQSISVDIALKMVQAAYPSRKIEEVRVRPHEAYLFGFENQVSYDYDGVFVDPGLGQINGYLRDSEHLIGWITVLHRALFATQINLPFIGNLSTFLMTLSAIALFVMVLTGAYLWYPGLKKLAFGFKLRLSKSVFIRHYDWHRVMGAIALPFLFIWALSGLLYVQRPLVPLWNAIVFSPSIEQAEVKSVPNGNPPIPYQEAIRLAEQATGYKAITISMTEGKPEDHIHVIVEAPGWYLGKYWEWNGTHEVNLDQYSGKILDIHQFDQQRFGIDFDSLLMIHFGSPVNPAWRLIWAFFGLMPLVLAFTGISMWWIKRQRRLHKQRCSEL